MARPVSIDEAALLRCAREVFLEKGFSVTTAEVAERAGVSEGTLFHRFGSKAALFNAAMRPDVEGALDRIDLEGRVGQGDLESSLIEIVTEIIEFLRSVMPCIMMSWSNREESGLPAMLLAENPPPLRVLRALSGYFEAEIRQGRLRAVDPEILARTCLGGAMHFVFLETLGALHGKLPLPQGMYVRGLVDIVLSGVSVRATRAAASSGAAPAASVPAAPAAQPAAAQASHSQARGARSADATRKLARKAASKR